MDVADLAILQRAKADAERTSREALRTVNSPAFQAAIREINQTSAALEETIQVHDAHLNAFAGLTRVPDDASKYALADYRPTSHYMLQEQRESRARLDEMLDIERQSARILTDVAGALSTLASASRFQSRIMAWTLSFAAIGALAAIAALFI
jgi:glutamate synthase domain-containing protein 2